MKNTFKSIINYFNLYKKNKELLAIIADQEVLINLLKNTEKIHIKNLYKKRKLVAKLVDKSNILKKEVENLKLKLQKYEK